MDLAELKFVVDTKQLEDAAKKIEALGTAVTELNAVQKQSTSASRDEAKASKEKAQADTAQVQAKDKLTEATEKSTKASRAAVSETDRLNKLTTNLENTFKDLSKGFTRGESNILNLARSFGATTEGIEKVKAELSKIGTLIKDPFDAAIGSVRSINQEFDKVTNRTNLAAQGIVLTTKQLSEYSRVATEISAKILSAGLDPTVGKGLADYTKGLDRVQQKYLGIAESVNIANNAEKERQRIAKEAQGPTSGSMDQAVGMYYKEQARAMKESSSAAAYLEKEMKRVDFVLSEVNAELQLSTSNRLLKYEEALKRTGVTGTQAATKLEAYRKSLQKVDDTRAFKRQTDDLKAYQEKVDYVTRAVGPQLTDIFSGLFTGQQSLYTIAVQQGGQLADQFSLAGIEANKMGGILASALPNMLTNITNIGKAFGQMAIGGLIQTGQGLIDLTLKATFLKKTFDDMSFAMAIMADTGDEATRRIYQGMLLAAKGTALFAGLLSATVIGAVVALGVALYQVIKQEDAFARTMALSGASLGMTQQSAITYARSLNDVGVSTSKALDVMSAMVKEGGFVKSEIELVTKSAVNMQKYAGVSIEDTVKAFAKLKDKPVEALTEVAAATGKIAPAVITAVSALMEQGRTAEAVSLAMRTLAEANNQSVNQIKADYSAFGSWIIEWGSSISNAWSNLFKNIMYKSSPEAQLREAIVDLEAKASSGGGQFFKAEYDAKIASLKEQLKLMTSASAATEEYTANQVKGAKEALKQSKASEELGKILLNQGKKQLSQADYVNQKIAEYTKGQGLAALSTENLAKATKAFNQEWKDAQSKTKANPAVKLLNQDLEKLTDIKNKALGLNKDYNNSEQTLVRLLNQGHLNLVEYTLAMADLNAQQPRAIKATADQAKAQNELTSAWKKTNEEQLKLDIEYFKDSAETVKQRQELELQSKEIEFQLSIVGKSEEQQKQLTREFQKQTKLRSAQVELERELKEIEQKYGGSSEGGSLVIDAYAKNAEKIKAINAGVALEFALDMQREFDSIKATITDAVVTALFDGGKAGSKKLRDAIVAQFRNKITIVVDAVVNTALNSGLSALGLGGSSGGGSLLGAASDLSGINSLGSTLASGFGKVAASSFGQSLGLSTTAGVAGPATAAGVAPTMLTSTGSSISAGLSAAGPYVAAAVAIYSIAKALDDSGTMHTGALSQYSATSGATTSQTHGAFGMGFGGVDYSEGAQKLTGEISKSIVTMLDATAVTFGKEAGYKAATAFADDSSKDGAWGGLLIQKLDETIINWDTTRSSKWAPREFSDAEAGQKEYLNAIALDTRNALESIGLPTWATKMLDAVGNAPTLESIAAVVDQINATKVALKSLGEVFPELVNISDTAIDNLITVFGGLGNFAASLQSYYGNFYTESEQIERATANTSKAFADLGITMPKVDESLRMWYRGIVESSLALDQGDIANAKATASVLALQNAVNELAPAFGEVEVVINDLSAILEELTTSVNSAYSQLENSVQAEKRTLQYQLDIASTRESIAQKAVDSLQEIFNTLKQSVKELYQEVDSTSAMQVQQAQGVIGSAVRSGSVKDINELKDAIDTVRGSLESTSYRTKADQDRARLLLANDLAKLQASTEVQLTNEEKILAEAKAQVATLQKQLDTLDDILEEAKLQVNAVVDNTNAVISVKDAINALSSSILAALAMQKEQQAKIAKEVQVQAQETYAGLDSKVSPTSVVATPQTEAEKTIASIYKTVLGREADTAGLAWWGNQGYSTSEIYSGIASSQEAQVRQQYGATGQNAYNTELNALLGNPNLLIPAFANGGNYKGGMALVGESGPELINFSQPGQVYTAGQTSSIMGGSKLEELVIKLNENIEGLRFEVRADVSHNSKIAKILDRVSPDGQSLSVTVLA